MKAVYDVGMAFEIRPARLEDIDAASGFVRVTEKNLTGEAQTTQPSGLVNLNPEPVKTSSLEHQTTVIDV